MSQIRTQQKTQKFEHRSLIRTIEFEFRSCVREAARCVRGTVAGEKCAVN